MASQRNGGQAPPKERRGLRAFVDSLGTLFRAVAFLATSFYSIALGISSFLNAGNIVRHEVHVMLQLGSILAETTGTGPSEPGGPSGPPATSGATASLDPAGVITIVICIFALFFFILVFDLWWGVITRQTMLASACVARDVWSWLGCTLRWILIVIEVLVFILITVISIFYIIINIYSLVVLAAIAIGIIKV